MPPVDGSGVPERPVLVRLSTLRYSYYKRVKRIRGERVNSSAIITIPHEIMEVAGVQPGVTMVVEGYAKGIIRIFPAGDIMNREEEMI